MKRLLLQFISCRGEHLFFMALLLLPLFSCVYSGSTQAKGSCQLSTEERVVFSQVNQERKKQNLNAIQCHPQLSVSAQYWSDKMCQNNFFSHQDPKGKEGFSNRMASQSQELESQRWQQQSAAENIYAGSPSGSSAMKAWMKSPGHRQNILNPSLSHIGIGYTQCKGKHLWTQVFTRMSRTQTNPSLLRHPLHSKANTKNFLLMKPGTRRRTQTQKQREFFQNGKKYIVKTTEIRTLTVKRGPRRGSRTIHTEVKTTTITQTGNQTSTKTKINRYQKTLFDF